MKSVEWEKTRSWRGTVGVVEDLIPAGQGDAMFWGVAARRVLEQIIQKLVRSGKGTDKDLKAVLSLPEAGIKAFLEGTAASRYLDGPAQQTRSILSVIVFELAV